MVARLTGTPAQDETWTVVLDGGASSHPYLVAGSDSLADIAQALAADINSNADAAFTAVADGDDLVIVNRAGTAFTAVVEIRRPDASLAGSFVGAAHHAEPAHEANP